MKYLILIMFIPSAALAQNYGRTAQQNFATGFAFGAAQTVQQYYVPPLQQPNLYGNDLNFRARAIENEQRELMEAQTNYLDAARRALQNDEIQRLLNAPEASRD